MTVYYNEFDKYAANWLRNLIAAGHIAPGVVDTRSIEDVRPSDLAGFKQCHFFAGVGVWSYALRAAGWPDDRPVWTGSCPCQPFSAAGQGAAFADERHLWPAFHHLIAERRPAIVLGEQVASKAVDDWIDLVHADLEALDYQFGSVPFPSAGVGAPHIRDRNYWVAYAGQEQRRRRPNNGSLLSNRPAPGRHEIASDAERSSKPGRLADADSRGASGNLAILGSPESERIPKIPGQGNRLAEHISDSSNVRPGPTNGFWADADWLGCRDGKWRPVEPGTFPLAHGAASRVGRLRAYGNAVNAIAAQTWIEVVMESIK